MISERFKRAPHAFLFIVGGTGIIFTLFSMIVSGTGHVWDNFIFAGGNDKFMDFMNHVRYCSEPSKVYFVSKHACFPPLAYVFYYAINRILPPDAITNFNASATHPYAYLVYVVYVAVLIVVFGVLVHKTIGFYGSFFNAAAEVQIVLSYTFVAGVFERGNAALLVAELLFAAMLLRESDNKWKRELALVLIAFAAGFKIYPALFGLMYIAEKRYKEAVRLVIYGVTAFFLPFAFFGGVAGLKQFIQNQTYIQKETLSIISLKNIVSGWLGKTSFPAWLQTSIVAATYIVALSAVVAGFILTKKLHERALFLVALMVLFPTSSGSYTLCYFLIPLMFFLRDEPKVTDINRFMDFAYGLCFTLFAFANAPVEDLPARVSIFGCYMAVAVAIADVAITTVKSFRDAKLRRAESEK